MSLRGYRLPPPPGISALPRVYPAGVDSGPSHGNEYEREYSACERSLSEGEALEDMPCWVRSPKRSTKQGRKGKGSVDSRSAQESKGPLVVPRNQNPGIDTALRNLHHEVGASLEVYQELVRCFELDIQPLQDWAEHYTLDTVWRNKIKSMCRDERDRQRLEGVAGRLAAARASIKEAMKHAKAMKEAWDDRYDIERQIRTARKTIPHCDGIISLAERAASERLACKELVVELEEVRCSLDKKKHPWIYGEHTLVRHAGGKRKQGSTEKHRSEPIQQNEAFEGMEDVGEGEEHVPLESVDDAPSQSQEDARDW